MLPQKAKNAIRGLYGIIGVAAIVLGVALLIWPGKTLGVAAVALGIYFVVSGVIRIVSAIVTLGLPSGWRILDILIGIMLSVGGVLMLKNAALSGQALAVFITMVVGLGWMMEGVMALAESWRLPSSGWRCCTRSSRLSPVSSYWSRRSRDAVPGDFLRMCADRHGCFLDGPRVQVRPSEA